MSTTTQPLEAPSTRPVLERAAAAMTLRRRAEVEVLESALAWAHAHVVSADDDDWMRCGLAVGGDPHAGVGGGVVR